MNLRVLEWPHKVLGILTWRCARLKRLLCVCGVPRGARKPYHVRPQSPISFGNSVPLQISPTFTLPSLLACKCGCEGRNALDALCIPASPSALCPARQLELRGPWTCPQTCVMLRQSPRANFQYLSCEYAVTWTCPQMKREQDAHILSLSDADISITTYG